MEFSAATFQDIESVNRFLKSGLTMDSAYAATTVFGWQTTHNARFCRTERYWLYAVDYGDETLYYAPLSATKEGFYEGIEALREMGVKEVFALNDWQAEYMRSLGCEIHTNAGMAEYVYNTSDLITLKGKKYHSKRNFINGFHYDYEFRPYREEDYEGVMALMHMWEKRHGEDTFYLAEGSANSTESDSQAEEYAISLALKNRELFRLIANVMVIDGKIAGFAAGERMANGMAVIFFEKGDISYKGIYPVLDNLFIKENFSDLPYVNKQEDMNIEGLRHSKLSYCPVFMLERYTAVFPC